MATGKALLCKLGKHIEIPGADRIVQVDMFGETIITQKTNEEGTVGLLFDIETCLSHEYASGNNMYRESTLNKDKTVKGYLEADRRIRPVRLKGVKCSGLFMPLDSLAFKSTDTGKYPNSIGTEIDSFDGVPLCEKYIAKSTRKAMAGNKQRALKQNLVPTFKEHFDSDQWARNTHKLKEGDLVILTEKLHGTSARCGYLPVKKEISLWHKLLGYLADGVWMKYVNVYEFVVGSRRVVKSIGGNESNNKQHYYNEDLWTKISRENFEGKLRKGETIYFEIVGYSPSGELIMPSVSNTKLKNFLSKEEYNKFIEDYSETTTFDYGCQNPLKMSANKDLANKIFVYRITMTNEDGDTIDYSWEQVKSRCDQMGVRYVSELDKDLIPAGFDHRVINDRVQFFTDNPSTEFPSHIREGVCVRVENGAMSPYVLKHKSFIFKVLEGIIKDSDQVDIEESN